MTIFKLVHESVSESKTVSISGSECNVVTHAQRSVNFNLPTCAPTIEPDRVGFIPPELLATVLEANLNRLSNFCSQEYVLDPRSNVKTMKIIQVIEMIRARLNT